MVSVKHSLISMITWIQVYWCDNSGSIEYTACIGDYPINEDDARSERILLAPAHDGIIADEDNRLLLNHLTHGTTDVIEFKLDYPISWNDDE